jgi:hypothetical protein
MNVCNISKEELDVEILSGSFSTDVTQKPVISNHIKKELPDLPFDSINLFDPIQESYYSSNAVFKKALNYIKGRQLNTAVNASPNLFISLTDFIHKNRVCIPFYDTNKKLVFYQSRSIDDSLPKYLGKTGYDKTLFGIDRIDANIPYIFIFEGPIDAMFVRNGVSSAGLTLTKKQNIQLAEFPFHEKIWVLDNPKFDKTAEEKTKELIINKQKIFKWTSDMPYKDFNELAMFEELNEIDYNKIINSLY